MRDLGSYLEFEVFFNRGSLLVFSRNGIMAQIDRCYV